MKSRLLIFLSVIFLAVLLVALNAASYVRVEEEQETEFAPDRSTENSGGTGTRALFEYLRASGRDAVRWKQPMSALSSKDEAPSSLVLVGPPRHEVERREADAILRWVSEGGRLVLVDRNPTALLLPASGHWRVVAETVEFPGPDVHPDDVETMTRDVPLVVPAQPTALTRDVAEVTRSRFASRLHVHYSAEAPTPTPTPEDEENPWEEEDESEPPPAPKAKTTPTSAQSTPTPSAQSTPAQEKQTGGAGGTLHVVVADEEPDANAPVVHVWDGRAGEGALLVDYAYGRGRVVVLSDPYVVSNAGLNRADNLFLATNVVTGGRRGRVAFDEFHQGYGQTQNQFFAYFRGTPILWMFAQGALVALALVWTRGRRFARAVPVPEADRRSKLEFVASMAELQQRARAYDLAVENIYQRTRRALARYGGLPAAAPRQQIAERVAARSGRDAAKLEALLRECEDAIAGQPLSARRALALVRELRELERDLGVLMRSREIRQAAAR
ncbi:MAG TPA: DUF4350 domain-containing protein [Pyrinomonadaceae bacterium]|nr:DUF4350 domain-containing protein [Pyrinomonadaceae bacterium]